MKRLAVLALWMAMNSASIAQAATSQPPEPNVQEFLDACSKADALSQSACDKPIHINILTMSIMQGMNRGSGICLPKDGDFPKLRTAIIQWLNGHQELDSKKEYDGVTAAMTALYPCG